MIDNKIENAGGCRETRLWHRRHMLAPCISPENRVMLACLRFNKNSNLNLNVYVRLYKRKHNYSYVMSIYCAKQRAKCFT